jgi:WD40 repeat protein/tRNA A-37 threonylcarbamoyl transferase component Bud32
MSETPEFNVDEYASTASSPRVVPDQIRLAPIGTKIGAYTLKRLIASGGMGTVYEAVQEQPRRIVALKIMKGGIASRSALRRFEFEAQLLARMRHPGIAQVYEAGTHDEGNGSVPFFAMEYIPGARTIIEYARHRNLGTRQRVDLFAKVCEAVHYGHSKGIIHRDLKPSNILVDATTGEDQPKIIDFGVARATDSDMTITTLQTDVGQLIGTLQYMSPEQCDADPNDLDVRSDVYAMGVVLFELLCGQLPYDLSRVAVFEAARVIREEPPTKPSTINRTLRGDVETITLKALAKDRTLRYQSALDLAHDLRRYLNNEPIIARPPSLTYQIRMFARRHRGVFVATLLILVTMVIALIVSIQWAISANLANAQATIDRDRAVAAQDGEKREAERANAKSEEAARAAGEAMAAEQRALLAAERAERQVYLANIAAADAAIRSSDFATANDRLEKSLEKYRDWEWNYLQQESANRTISLTGHHGPITALGFSPDGQQLVTASGSDVRWWDVESGTEAGAIALPDAQIADMAISQVGMRLVLGCSDGALRLYNPKTREQLSVIRTGSSPVTAVTYSLDCRLIGVGTLDGSIQIWNAATGERQSQCQPDRGPIRSITLISGESRLAFATAHGDVCSWSAEEPSQPTVLMSSPAQVNKIAINPEARLLAIALEDGACIVWNLAENVIVSTLRGHNGPVRSVSFSRDGLTVATGSDDHTIRLWNPMDGTPRGISVIHASPVTTIAFSPNGQRLASGSNDSAIRIVSLARLDATPYLHGHQGPVTSVAVRSDGSQIASGSQDSSVRLWNVSTGTVKRILTGHNDYVLAVAYSPNGEQIASASRDRTIRIWNSANGDTLGVLSGHEGDVTALAYSSDGKMIVSGSWDRSIRLWSSSTHQQLRLLHGTESYIAGVAFTADGGSIISVSGDGSVRIWSVTDDQTVIMREHLADVVTLARFNSNGSDVLATGSIDQTIRLWDLAKHEQIAILQGHADPVLSVAVNPSGTRIASGGLSSVVRLWSSTAHEEITTLRGHAGPVRCVSFSPDGSWLVSGSDDGTLRIWGRR